MRGWLKRGLIGLGGIVALAIAATAGFAGFVAYRLETSVPALRGAGVIAQADGEIRIVRDAYGVPHIFAGAEADLYRGLGFAHAQDRFVQMDLTRRAMLGRLAEVVGDRAIEMDARARINGWRSVAQGQLERLTPETLAVVQAYSEGVNAALAVLPTPPEYALLMAKPEPWRPIDSLATALAMTDALTGGELPERLRAMLSKTLSPAQIDQFLTGYPAWGARSYQGGDLVRPAALTDGGSDGAAPGSNAWVVSGARTGTGKPILANDPHLPLNAPGPFYLSRLQGPDGPLIGASLPGAPMIVIGRTRDLAWGTTTHQIDAIDDAPLADGEPVTESREVIGVNVAGLFMREVVITVRRTARGPVLEPRWWASEKSFGLAYGDRPVVRRSIAHDPANGLAGAVYLASKAKTVDGYFAAMAGWTAPPQNLVVADTQGAIGLISAGRFPLRDSNGVWTGMIAQPLMARDPARGFFATANNLQTPADYPFPMPGGHDPYRATLIDEALAADAAHGRERALALQNDTQSLLARRLAPVIATGAPKTEAGKAMQAALVAWDGDASLESQAATQFAYWTRAISEALYGDELGAAMFKELQGPRDVFVDAALTDPGFSGWCDDVSTPAQESCGETVGAALDVAAAALSKERGAAAAGWAWGPIHAARFRNLVWSGLPLVGDGFTVDAPFGGNSSSINVARNRHNQPGYHTVHAAGLRMVVDFSDLNASRYIIAPGQSGHPRSPHYRDLAQLWGKGLSIEIRDDWGPGAPPPGAQMWTLTPAN